MKKLITLSLCLLTSILLAVFAAAAPTEQITAYVTIADASGKQVLAASETLVSDKDEDGKITINDALICAHDNSYDGGAAKGYGTAVGDYGLYITNLWGSESSTGFGYYLNHGSVMSITDEITAGDYISAFVYVDTENFSDKYCYFDNDLIKADDNGEVTLTLLGAGYDANWQPITTPVANAIITVNGKDTEYRTDADGKVTFKPEGAAMAIIGARSESEQLVPPVCKVILSTAGASAETAEQTPADAEQSNFVIYAIIVAAAVAIAAAVIFAVRKRRA